MIRSAVLAFAAGTALIASPGFILWPTAEDRPAQADGPAAPPLVDAPMAADLRIDADPGSDPDRGSAAAALGLAAGAAAATMRYQ